MCLSTKCGLGTIGPFIHLVEEKVKRRYTPAPEQEVVNYLIELQQTKLQINHAWVLLLSSYLHINPTLLKFWQKKRHKNCQATHQTDYFFMFKMSAFGSQELLTVRQKYRLSYLTHYTDYIILRKGEKCLIKELKIHISNSSSWRHEVLYQNSQVTHSNHLLTPMFRAGILIFSILIIDSFQWPLRQLRVGSCLNNIFFFSLNKIST